MTKLDNQSIADRFKAGKTIIEIGDEVGRTHQRISQILKSMGVSRREGGAALRPTKKAMLRAASEKRCMKMWGITIDERQTIKATFGYSPFSKFIRHRENASRRGIPFLITFSEWWNFWVQSGKWKMRGLNEGQYVMSRHGDLGAYEIGNVKICLSKSNIREWHDRQKIS